MAHRLRFIARVVAAFVAIGVVAPSLAHAQEPAATYIQAPAVAPVRTFTNPFANVNPTGAPAGKDNFFDDDDTPKADENARLPEAAPVPVRDFMSPFGELVQVESHGLQEQVAGPGARDTALALHHIDVVLSGGDSTPKETVVQECSGNCKQGQIELPDGTLIQGQEVTPDAAPAPAASPPPEVINRAPSANSDPHGGDGVVGGGGVDHGDAGSHNAMSGGDGGARK